MFVLPIIRNTNSRTRPAFAGSENLASFPLRPCDGIYYRNYTLSMTQQFLPPFSWDYVQLLLAKSPSLQQSSIVTATTTKSCTCRQIRPTVSTKPRSTSGLVRGVCPLRFDAKNWWTKGSIPWILSKHKAEKIILCTFLWGQCCILMSNGLISNDPSSKSVCSKATLHVKFGPRLAPKQLTGWNLSWLH